MANCIYSKFKIKLNRIIYESIRGRKFWTIPPNLSTIELPPEEERSLPPMEAIPDWHGVRPRKFEKSLHDIKGPELINNELIHKQFGLVALTGVQLGINHINLIRTVVNKHMDVNKMFAIWRIEPPWKPVSKKSQGKTMGGGKASIHHYVTPIRAGHIIIEIGGRCEFADVLFFLESIAKRMPCDTFPISQQMLEEWKEEDDKLKENNINPFSFERVIINNMQGCHHWISPYDKRWYGKFE